MTARAAGAGVAFTRNLNEVTERLPEVTERARRLPASQVVLDGEVILEG